MKKNTVLRLAVSAVVAAAYAALTVALAPISYGAVQFRVSEALTALPFLMPSTVWGIFAGCILANLFTGNLFDIVFGSLATLGAALTTAYFGTMPIWRNLKWGIIQLTLVTWNGKTCS